MRLRAPHRANDQRPARLEVVDKTRLAQATGNFSWQRPVANAQLPRTPDAARSAPGMGAGCEVDERMT
jgi:hypothetical protein